jgi:hypothetical protein
VSGIEGVVISDSPGCISAAPCYRLGAADAIPPASAAGNQLAGGHLRVNFATSLRYRTATE